MNRQIRKRLGIVGAFLILVLFAGAAICSFKMSRTAKRQGADGQPVAILRLYNPDSGEYFYTKDVKEWSSLLGSGWQADGVGWYAPKKSNSPVYQLNNPKRGGHRYTLSKVKRNLLMLTGWQYEGISWYSSDDKAVPIYRQVNPNGNVNFYHFTDQKQEAESLKQSGWKSKRTAWYGMQGGQKTWIGEQYSLVPKLNGMFYSISDPYGKLVLVDGGWDGENAQRVLEVIRAHQNHVSAWIVTHPHPDHVRALNEILRTHPEVQIDTIYAPNVNQKRYEETARNYDDYPAYMDFLKETAGHKVVYLKENDTLDLLDGLKMKVFSAWDATTDTFSHDLCNLGSLMFKLTGGNKSILFCGDTHRSMERKVLEAHGDELGAEYLQTAHHGSNGLSLNFYDHVHPEVAFMDSQDTVARSTTSGFKGYQVNLYFVRKGVTVNTYSDGDYVFVL